MHQEEEKLLTQLLYVGCWYELSRYVCVGFECVRILFELSIMVVEVVRILFEGSIMVVEVIRILFEVSIMVVVHNIVRSM